MPNTNRFVKSTISNGDAANRLLIHALGWHVDNGGLIELDEEIRDQGRAALKQIIAAGDEQDLWFIRSTVGATGAMGFEKEGPWTTQDDLALWNWVDSHWPSAEVEHHLDALSPTARSIHLRIAPPPRVKPGKD